MAVRLIHASVAEQAADGATAATLESPSLDALQRRLEIPHETAAPAPDAMSTESLAALLRDRSSREGGDPVTGGAGGEDDTDPYGRASFDQAASGARAARDRIQLQASTCLDLAAQSGVVWLEVRLRRDGRLAGDVQVVHGSGALAAARTDSERRAVRAVARCAPYGAALGTAVGRTYRFDLGRPIEGPTGRAG